MSNIIKNSRVINKKIIQKDDSVFLVTSKIDSSKINLNKSDDETDYNETDVETEKDDVIEKDDDETEKDDDIEKEDDVEKDDDVEKEELDEPITEEGEYKIKTGEQCVYNNLEDEIIIDDDIEVEEKDEEIIVQPEDRITKNRLTSYEKVRILGLRAKQISLGAKILLKNYGNRTPLEIAELELKHKVLPFKIKRPLANKHIEIWKLSELKV